MPSHTYSIKLIYIWCEFILAGAISLRSSSRVLSIILKDYYGELATIPSWYTGRLWLIRLGYYKLNREKEKADDWIWIIDHSVQIGSTKCFVILGIRLSNLPDNRSLKYDDVEPIELLPVEKSNGEIVYEQLEATTEKTGIPRAIVGDYGSDIKKGIEIFCEYHNETDYIYDVKHKMASLLKKYLNNNDRWKEFVKLANKTKKRVQQTSLAALAPPQQRSKARYMNTEFLLDWGKNMLRFLSQNDIEVNKQEYNNKDIKRKMSWVMDFGDDIQYWNTLLDMATITENVIRKKRISDDTGLKLEKNLNDNLPAQKLTNSLAQQFKNDIIEFANAESKKAKPGEHLLGSSEIIESVFGKQKFIEKEQSKSGFTSLLLTLGAIVSETNTVVIKKALESTPVKKIKVWYKENIQKSVQSKRMETFSVTNNAEQKWNQLLAT